MSLFSVHFGSLWLLAKGSDIKIVMDLQYIKIHIFYMNTGSNNYFS
jgi:hypothetical protein